MFDDDENEAADLGGIGESTLETWAHEVGITPNRVQHDKKGWDFFLQLPLRKGEASPAKHALDIRPSEMCCLVQVKATRNIDKYIDVKLSNWEHLTKTPIPTFFIVFAIDAKNKVEAAYLVHVGERWIGQVIKRLCELPPDRINQLHKQTLQLTWTEDDKLSNLNGRALLSAIREVVGDSSLDYLIKKKGWIECVGYDKNAFMIEFSMSKENESQLYEQMADFAIGRLKKLPVTSMRACRIRFGIELPLDKYSQATDIAIELPAIPSVGETIIEVSDPTSVEIVVLKCQTHAASALFPSLPLEYHKLSLTNGSVTAIISPTKGNPQSLSISWNIKLPGEDDPVALEDVLPAAKLARLIKKGVRTRFRFGEQELVLPNEHTSHLTQEDLPPEFLAYASMFERAHAVASRFGVPSSVRVKPGELLDQSNALASLSAIISVTSIEMSVSAKLTSSLDESIKSVAILLGWKVKFAEYSLLVLVAVSGSPEWERRDCEDYLTVTTPSPEIAAYRVLRHPETTNVTSLYDEAERTLKAKGIEVVIRPGPDDELLKWVEDSQ